ncbi:MAG: GHKL domain-containing protein [Clostridiaceae bacterium]
MSVALAYLIRFMFNICDGFIINAFGIIFFEEKIRIKKVLLSVFFLASAIFFTNEFTRIHSDILFIVTFSLLEIILLILGLKISLNKSFINLSIIIGIYLLTAMITEALIFLIFKMLNFSVQEDSMTFLIWANIILYLIEFVILFVMKLIKSRKKFINITDNKNYLFIAVFVLFTCFLLFMNFSILYLGIDINNKFSSQITLMVIFLIYFLLNVVLGLNFIKFQARKQELEQQKFYNDTMETLIINLRAAKHGFDNTLASISGFINMEDWDKLKDFFSEIEVRQNSLSSMNISMYSKIKSAGAAGVIISKYEYMKSAGINGKLFIDEPVIEINMKISEFCEVLGIMLDNAIEAAIETKERCIRLDITKQDNVLTFHLENSCNNKPDLVKIFEKGWSTKGENRGLGLWIAKSITKKYKNVLFNTFINDNKFVQELIIS